MYKAGSDRHMTSLHRGRPSDWVNGQERLSNADQLLQMQDGVRILEERMKVAPWGEARRTLGREKLALQLEISKFRKLVHMERQANQGIGEIFMTMAREMLPKVQFELILGATHRELDRRKKEVVTTEASIRKRGKKK